MNKEDKIKLDKIIADKKLAISQSHLRFTDEHTWPFNGIYTGYRLKHIPMEFLRQYFKDHNFIKTPNESCSEFANRYQTVKGKLLSYIRKRIKATDRKPKNYYTKNSYYVNNGKIRKRIQEGRPIPEGFKKGYKLDNHNFKLNVRKYTKLYYNFFGYTIDPGFFVPCELTGQKAVDIHHISCGGMGGTDQEDTIENLMALTRDCHQIFGDKKQFNDILLEAHLHFINHGESLIQHDPHNIIFDELLKFNKWKNLVLKARRLSS